MNTTWSPKLSLALLFVFSNAIPTPLTPLQKCLGTFATLFVLGSLRMYAKGLVKEKERTSVWTDPLKVWQMFYSKEYWNACDEQIIGTYEIKYEVTIEQTSSTDPKEVVTTPQERKLQYATGIFGYYIYKMTLSPIKQVYEVVKPVGEGIVLLCTAAKYFGLMPPPSGNNT